MNECDLYNMNVPMSCEQSTFIVAMTLLLRTQNSFFALREVFSIDRERTLGRPDGGK